MRRTESHQIAVAWFFLAAIIPVGSAEETVPSIDEVLSRISSYEFGQSREPLSVVEDMVRRAGNSPDGASRLASSLVPLLATDASLDCKRFLCRQLKILGAKESVPALSALLLDEELSDMARYALERIDGGSAERALLEALLQSNGRISVGLINSLGNRGDESAISDLAKRIGDADVAVAEAAIAALGRIGGEQAAAVLARNGANISAALHTNLMDAYLSCADQFLKSGEPSKALTIYDAAYQPAEPIWIRVAAFEGLVAVDESQALQRVLNELTGGERQLQAAALGLVRKLPGQEATQAFVTLLPQLPPEQQARLLDALGDSGDRTALPSVMTAIESDDQGIRTAALRALGPLGDARAVSLLARFASQTTGAEQAAARASLTVLQGEEVDRTIRSLLEDAEVPQRAELIACLGPRGAVWAIETLKESARNPDAETRLASLKALGDLAGEGDMPVLVELLVQAASAEEREQAGKAVLATSRRISDADRRVGDLVAALSEANEHDIKIALMALLSRMGGTKAVAAVGARAQDEDVSISDAAVKALADWSDQKAMPSLWQIARTGDSPQHRVLALAGYIRLLRHTTPRTSQDLLGKYQAAFALATRVQEKRQILSGLRSVRVPSTLEFVLTMLHDEELGKEAAMTAVYLSGLGRRTKIPDEDAVAAVKQVLAVSQDAAVRSMAETVLQSRTGR